MKCDWCGKPAIMVCMSRTLFDSSCVAKRCEKHACTCHSGIKMTLDEYQNRDTSAAVEVELISKLGRIIGYVPLGTKDLLHVLVHPDLIELTEAYIAIRKVGLSGSID